MEVYSVEYSVDSTKYSPRKAQQAKTIGQFSNKTTIAQFIDDFMDRKVNERNYDNVLSAISYIDSGNDKYRAEAKAVSAWRDKVWEQYEKLVADVEAGIMAMPAIDEILAGLPPLEWGVN